MIPLSVRCRSKSLSTTLYPPLCRRSAVFKAAIFAALLCCQYGCVATKYKLVNKATAPVQSLNIAFPPSLPLLPMLVSLVSYGGPGSWKRAALWDEYVVTFENRGERPLTIDSATLADSTGAPHTPGSNPWALEKQSKALEKQYRNRGESFLRAAGPGVLIFGVGAASISASAGATSLISGGAAAGAAAVTLAILPVYYLAVAGVNHHNKKAVMTEFKRRRLSLPLTIAPGEIRTGSLFYPMVRSPSSLTLNWSTEGSAATAELPLEFLRTLHVPPALPSHVPK